MRLIFLLLLIGCGKDSDPAPFIEAAEAAQKPIVIYIGGYGADQKQVDHWMKASTVKDPSRTYKAYGYPVGAGSGNASAIAGAKSTIASVVKSIDSNPSAKYVIAGHSSGAAISNRIAELVKEPSHIRLVNLDGFAPSKALQKKVHSTCWYAKNGKHLSRNAGAMTGSCVIHKAFNTNVCTDPWCLHNVLVNKTPWGGYTSAIDPNLDWAVD